LLLLGLALAELVLGGNEQEVEEEEDREDLGWRRSWKCARGSLLGSAI
jgi:hypothetical protein